MHLKIMEWNAQDFFLQLEYPVSKSDIDSMTDEQWKLLARTDVHLKPLAKIKMIADIITEVSPDVVCFCEVGGHESLEMFARLFLLDRYEAFLVEGNSNRGIESGFLVKRGLGLKTKIKSHRNWPVPFEYPHEKDPVTHKLAAEAAAYYDLGHPKTRKLSRDVPALFLGKPGQTALVILLVHLKSGFDTAGVDPEGKIRRAAELEALLAIHASVQNHVGPSVPIILTGDFNGRAGRYETGPEFAPLLTSGFEDVLHLKEVPPYERISQLTFVRSQIIAKQLDFIFIPEILHGRVREAYVYRYRFPEDQTEITLPSSFRDRARLPSDHYPLVCELEIDV
ncbi:MAG: hypothetical protein H7249_04510 [Chitinophagaceae bacterium]|nr:hypothetical protein [Oligoflexus sp.]